MEYKGSPLWLAILVSRLIAFVEYCFQVPANRIGSYQFSGAQLKVIQEVITLVVFAVFSVLYLRQSFRWNYVVGFILILAAVIVVFGLDTGPDAPVLKTHGPPAASANGAPPT